MGPNPTGLVSLKEEIRTQRDNPVRTQGGDGHLHAQERGLRKNQPAETLISDFQPQTFSLQDRENFCYFSHPVYGTLLWQPSLTNI